MEKDKKIIEFEETVETGESFDTLDDFAPSFIKNPKVGEKIEFTIKGLKKLPKEECEFMFKDPKTGNQKRGTTALSNVDYGVQITTSENRKYNIPSWQVWGQLKQIMQKLNNKTGEGIELQVDHVKNGLLEENKNTAWQVRVRIDGKWKGIDKESKEYTDK